MAGQPRDPMFMRLHDIANELQVKILECEELQHQLTTAQQARERAEAEREDVIRKLDELRKDDGLRNYEALKAATAAAEARAQEAERQVDALLNKSGERIVAAMLRTCLRCRRPFEDEQQIFRCIDCCAELHRDCAREHFGERVWPPKQACAVEEAFQQMLKDLDAMKTRVQHLEAALRDEMRVRAITDAAIVGVMANHINPKPVPNLLYFPILKAVKEGMAAALTPTAPAGKEGAIHPAAVYDDRPFCRDCADLGPICPRDGKPCDPRQQEGA